MTRECLPGGPHHVRLLTVLGLSALAAPLAQARQGAPELPAPGAPAGEQEIVDGPAVRPGEKLPPEAFGPSVIEDMAAVMQRQLELGDRNGPNPKLRNGAQGEWEVPSRRFAVGAHSGAKYISNRWGDTRMGVGFGRVVDVDGAWFAGHGTRGVWPSGIQVVGYLDGAEVARSEWFDSIDRQPAWFAMDLVGVDRIEVVARPAHEGAAWYALDDLAFRAASETGALDEVVLDFEDLAYRTRLTGSGYAGLEWEVGTGDFTQDVVTVPPPGVPPGTEREVVSDDSAGLLKGGGGTPPDVLFDFAGPRNGDAGANLVPPDTCGAVGPTHFVAATNANLSIYLKSTGVRVTNVSLQNFWNTNQFIGDPRVVYDEHDDRWAMLCSNFSNSNSGVWFAYSLTSDPTGAWFKVFIDESQGSDAGNWVDYPTLGVDENGIYTASYMVGGNFLMSVFAIDKAPLLGGSPSIGTVTAWRQLPWEGAIQPCVTHGSSGAGVYLISRRSSTTLRLRQITGNLGGSPNLNEIGNVQVPSHSSPPEADQPGTTLDISTVDWRPMNAVFRNGSVWTAHCINVSNRAAVRWYQINASTASTVQVGTISDGELEFYDPGIDVNASNAMVVGFSGSGPNDFVGAYAAGRTAADPLGQTGPPVLYQPGQAAYTVVSGGTVRWGDYSLTTVDPVDDTTFWTIQEYAPNNPVNAWRTRIAEVKAGDTCAPPIAYCTPKISSNFCVPVISGSGTPSLSAPTGFTIDTSFMERNSNSITFFGVSGQAATPFQGGTLCVAGTVFRLPLQNSGLVPQCSGSISYDLFDVISHPSGGALVGVGTQLNLQTWGRDPGDPFTTSLSGGLELIVCP